MQTMITDAVLIALAITLTLIFGMNLTVSEYRFFKRPKTKDSVYRVVKTVGDTHRIDKLICILRFPLYWDTLLQKYSYFRGAEDGYGYSYKELEFETYEKALQWIQDAIAKDREEKKRQRSTRKKRETTLYISDSNSKIK